MKKIFLTLMTVASLSAFADVDGTDLTVGTLQSESEQSYNLDFTVDANETTYFGVYANHAEGVFNYSSGIIYMGKTTFKAVDFKIGARFVEDYKFDYRVVEPFIAVKVKIW